MEITKLELANVIIWGMVLGASIGGLGMLNGWTLFHLIGWI